MLGLRLKVHCSVRRQDKNEEPTRGCFGQCFGQCFEHLISIVTVDMDTLLKESDFVTAHTALTSETAGERSEYWLKVDSF